MKKSRKTSEIDILMWLSLFLNDKVFIDSLLENEWKCANIVWSEPEFNIKYDLYSNSIWSDYDLNSLKILYPEIAFLFKLEKLYISKDYNLVLGFIKNIDWIDLNNKVIWDDEAKYRAVLWDLYLKECDINLVVLFLDDIRSQISDLDLKRIGVESL